MTSIEGYKNNKTFFQRVKTGVIKLLYPYPGNQTIQMSGNIELLLVFVGNIMTPVKISLVTAMRLVLG